MRPTFRSMRARLGAAAAALAVLGLSLGPGREGGPRADELPKGVVRLGGPSMHYPQALSVHFPADGKSLLAGGWAEVREWGLKTKALSRRYRGEKWHAWDLTTTPDGRQLVVRDFDGDVLLLDRAENKVVRHIRRGGDQIQAFAVSPDGKTLAAGMGQGELRLWDLATGRQRRFRAAHPVPPAVPQPGALVAPPKSPPWITYLAFSPDGKTLTSSAMGDVVRGWSVATGRQVWALGPKETRDGPFAFAADGKSVAAPTLVQPLGPLGRNGPCGYALWSVPGGKKGTELEGTVGAYRVAFSPDGKSIAAGGGGCRLKVWDARTGKLRFSAALGSSVSGLEFSRDSKFVACVSTGLGLWEVASGREVLGRDGHTGVVTGIVVSADGKRVATSGAEGSIRLWDAKTGRQQTVLPGHEQLAWGVALSPDGASAASVGMDGALRAWDLATGRPRWRFTFRVDDQLGGVAYSPDGKWVGVAGGNLTIHLIDAATGKRKAALVGYDGFGQNGGSVFRFSPTGKQLAAPVRQGPGGGGIRNEENRRRPGLAFDPRLGPGSEPDGKTRVALWDLATGRRVRLLGPAGEHTPAFAFSPDGDLLAVGAPQAADTAIVDVRTGAVQQRLKAPGGQPLAFTPDGKRLFAGAVCFDLATGRKAFALPVEAQALAVFPDSRKVAVVDGRDGTASVWDLAGR
jgi:WD40 repeat protein